MRFTALALVLALTSPAFAQSADAGVVFDAKDPLVQPAKSADLTVREDASGVTKWKAGPGCYVRADLCMTLGEKVARMEAENKALRKEAETPPGAVMKALLIGAGIGLLVGAGATVYLLRPWER